MTAPQIARKLNLNIATVYKRLKSQGEFVKDYNHDYDREVFLSMCHDKYSSIKRKKLYQTKEGLDIIHLYFNSKDNRVSVIAKELNETEARVNYVINKFLKTGEINLESKINFNN